MSGRRNLIRKYQVFTNADSAASPSTIATDVSGVDNVTYILNVGAAVAGTIQVQFCNDPEVNVPGSHTFKPLDFGAAISITGATEQDYTFKIENHGFKWLRLVFTNGAGTGNLNAWVTGTSFGA